MKCRQHRRTVKFVSIKIIALCSVQILQHNDCFSKISISNKMYQISIVTIQIRPPSIQTCYSTRHQYRVQRLILEYFASIGHFVHSLRNKTMEWKLGKSKFSGVPSLSPTCYHYQDPSSVMGRRKNPL